jgi:glycosyltransferase involved in cell wall biosynthesis
MTDERLKELPIRVIVAGEYYSNRAEFEKLIDETGVGDRLDLFNDFIPDEEVATYFSAADLVVQPYKHATQSGVTQIAYHFEKPMIVTNVGGLPEIVPHGKAGYVVEPEPKAIADAIVDFMSQVDHVALIEGVKGEKAKYGWDQMVLRIDEVDRQVMASRGQ